MSEYQKIEFADLEPGDEVLIGATWCDMHERCFGIPQRISLAIAPYSDWIEMIHFAKLGVECRRKVKREPWTEDRLAVVDRHGKLLVSYDASQRAIASDAARNVNGRCFLSRMTEIMDGAEEMAE